jgi:hypothetical protein
MTYPEQNNTPKYGDSTSKIEHVSPGRNTTINLTPAVVDEWGKYRDIASA